MDVQQLQIYAQQATAYLDGLDQLSLGVFIGALSVAFIWFVVSLRRHNRDAGKWRTPADIDTVRENARRRL